MDCKRSGIIGILAGVFGIIALSTCPAYCGETQASKVVVGYWKMDSDAQQVYLEITKDYLRSGNRPPVDIAIDDRDGRAVVRLAGRDIVAAVITVETSDRIIIHDQGSNAKDPFVRITKDDFEKGISG